MTTPEHPTIDGPNFEYTFDASRGTLRSLERGGQEFIEQGPRLNVWRTPISNEEVDWGAAEAEEWYELGLDRLEHEVESIEVTEVDDGVTRVRIEALLFAPDTDARFETTYLYHVFGTGDVLLGVRAVPNAAIREGITNWLPRVGVQLELPEAFDELSWHGNGPVETYPDRNDGTKIDTYAGSVAEQYVPYVSPQEYGNKTNVRWATLATGRGVGLDAFGYPQVNVSAHDVANLDRARFEYQLESRDGVVCNVDHAVTGVGGTPVQARSEHRVVPDGPFEFVVGFRPRVGEDPSPMELSRRRLPYAFASTNAIGEFEADYIPETGTITASAVVRNAGGDAAEIDAPLTIDGEVVSSRTVELQPGAKTDVAFEYDAPETGVFEVAIGDASPVLFTAPRLSLAGTWRFRAGDDPAWATPGYDDGDWESVELPATWEEHSDYTENDAFGWYRRSFDVPETWAGYALSVPVGRVDDVDETFLNGDRIGQTGSFPADEGGDGYESAWERSRRYTVPPSAIEFGGENVVAVRVYDGGGDGGLYDGPLGPITAVSVDD
ncbi:beta-galactosidase small subunit [Natrialba asiatica]|uniref:beta-galactosidase n=1 Tax=Natrialba asiatica (strain ATCC 700177 / DSM 12278 / JCM 9576 / FERM P-10747 / NBRC 102637 / 172P1) TaxID=29540 RepID=M0B4Z9_NATA1|nr:beta galactosidase jelly roll domain-containing protein [Natrialba asiatica]ELZ05976.1 glycoside hydrolase family protein [Natrialba asiatica DSM 12278]